MLLQILANTPKWVFVLFAALLWLGLNQLLTRKIQLTRVTLIALGMGAFSFYGAASAFAANPMALLAWLVAMALAAAVVMQRPLPAATRYDPASQRLTVPGSAVPLALMMGIFFTKYAVGVSLAMQPVLATHLDFALAVSTLYGVFSGIFAARAARLWRLAMAQEHQPVVAAL